MHAPFAIILVEHSLLYRAHQMNVGQFVRYNASTSTITPLGDVYTYGTSGLRFEEGLLPTSRPSPDATGVVFRDGDRVIILR